MGGKSNHAIPIPALAKLAVDTLQLAPRLCSGANNELLAFVFKIARFIAPHYHHGRQAMFQSFNRLVPRIGGDIDNKAAIVGFLQSNDIVLAHDVMGIGEAPATVVCLCKIAKKSNVDFPVVMWKITDLIVTPN